MSKKVAIVLLLVACHGADETPTTTDSPSRVAAQQQGATPVETAAPAAPIAVETAAPAAPGADETSTTSVDTPVRAQVTTAAPATAPRAAGDDWRTRVSSELAALRASAPQLLDELARLEPRMTRARFLRFTSSTIHDPRAAAVFLDRLARGGESEPVRAALAEALPRTGGDFADAVVELMATEPSALVRSAYVFAARRAPAAQAITMVKRGLADASTEVQAEAARTAGAHPDGNRLASELRAALASPDPVVRAEVASTLGILKIAAARDELVAQLDHASADVRLEALRAIEQIEPGYARTLPLAKLAKDDDPRITALVTRITRHPAPMK